MGNQTAPGKGLCWAVRCRQNRAKPWSSRHWRMPGEAKAPRKADPRTRARSARVLGQVGRRRGSPSWKSERLFAIKSLGQILKALGVRLLLVEDQETTARTQRLMGGKRNESYVREGNHWRNDARLDGARPLGRPTGAPLHAVIWAGGGGAQEGTRRNASGRGSRTFPKSETGP
jgi:hypothetical protein